LFRKQSENEIPKDPEEENIASKSMDEGRDAAPAYKTRKTLEGMRKKVS
jgi:hypothetical protein